MFALRGVCGTINVFNGVALILFSDLQKCHIFVTSEC